MALEERQLLAVEGIVIASVDVVRDPLVAANSPAGAQVRCAALAAGLRRWAGVGGAKLES